MQHENILDSLEKLLADLSIEIRYEKGDFWGGLYRYKNKAQLIVNKDLKLPQKINVIAKELRENFDLESLYLVPALREVIENESSME